MNPDFSPNRTICFMQRTDLLLLYKTTPLIVLRVTKRSEAWSGPVIYTN
jgi:hypothetical protein